MRGSTINMYFGEGTYIGHTLLSYCPLNRSPEYVAALLYKNHGRVKIPALNFDYWKNGDDTKGFEQALGQLAQLPKEDLRDEMYRFAYFVAKMEGTEIPNPPAPKPLDDLLKKPVNNVGRNEQEDDRMDERENESEDEGKNERRGPRKPRSRGRATRPRKNPTRGHEGASSDRERGVSKGETKAKWKIAAATLFGSLAGTLGILAFFKPELKPIAKIIRLISELF